MLADRLNKAWTARRGSNAIDLVMRFADEGLVLGAGTVLAKSAGASRDISIDPGEPRLHALLAAAHLRRPTAASLAHLRKAAQRWSEGEAALAAMHLALSRLDRLERPETDAHRLFLADGLLRAGFEANAIINAVEAGDPAFDRLGKYDPNQPRVPAGSGRPSGEWTSTDGGSSVGTASGAALRHPARPGPAGAAAGALVSGAPRPLAYPPLPGVNPGAVTEVTQPIVSAQACRIAQVDCVNTALRIGSRDPVYVSRFLGVGNCMSAGLACDTLSWITEDTPLGDWAAVLFPHGGIVTIVKGRADHYYPPKPDGSNPLR